MLKFYLLLIIALPFTQAIRLFLTNNDGVDDSNIRSLYQVLEETREHQLILCAPEIGNPPRRTRGWGLLEGEVPEEEMPEEGDLTADDGGSSSDDGESLSGNDIWDNDPFPKNPRIRSVPPPQPPELAIGWGLLNLAPKYYKPLDPAPKNQPKEREFLPDLFLAGPRVGRSLSIDLRSDQASRAVQQYARLYGRPSISFAGANGYDDRSRPYWSRIYAQLAKNIIQTVIESGKPYLPKDTHLHVNFPPIDVENARCTDLGQFKFILTRESEQEEDSHYDRHSGKYDFPYEFEVMYRREWVNQCYVSMSLLSPPAVVFDPFAFDLSPFAKAAQRKNSDRKEIIDRLRPILSHIPEM
ncbi:hypothetical protein BDU57DRAFT_524698 [Ampelomyces quisqualis]|uniref:Survival protein SurE-like phosphatase/nucleotidase domain-containing protein n=1 Tax=Ampelomyces quisqualis TaxID=50730 RepID=A0A6A5QAB4_AMPQU|nr:hypothetical protein BDU57DRAFT_524698 [Ampelomyces quisqualis]